MHVAAAIDIDPVAIGVDLQVVDGEVVDPRGQDGEMTAVQNGEIPQRDVAAILQADGLVGYSWILRLQSRARAFTQALAPDEPRSEDSDVVKILAPDQAVAPVAVAVVLILPPLVRFRWIVSATSSWRRWIGGHQRSPFSQVQRDIALEVD